MNRKWITLFLFVSVLGYASMSNAELTTIGTANYLGKDCNLIFEGELNGSGLIWLDYTKYSDSWDDQIFWVENLLNFSETQINLNPGYSTTIDLTTGWRLPSVNEDQANMGAGRGWAGPDSTGYHDYEHGYNMTNSEMGHLFYVTLGNLGFFAKDGSNPQPDFGLLETGDFEDLQPNFYWLGTEYSSDTDSTWGFFSTHGQQYTSGKFNSSVAMAVQSGTVSAVPIPGAFIFLGTGLIALVGIRRKNKE